MDTSRDNNSAFLTSQKLLENEQRFKKFFELGQIGMAITSLEKRWVDYNDSLCNMFGYTREEFARLTWSELTHPEDIDADVLQFNRVLAGEIDGYSMDKRFIQKSGNIIYTSISVNAIRKANRSVDYFIAFVVDITERKTIEQRLTLSEEKYRAMFETSQVGMALSDTDGTLLEVNKGYLDIIGYTREEASKLTYWDITPYKYNEQEEIQLHSLATTGKYGPYEKEYIHKDGHLVPVLLNGSLINVGENKKCTWSIIHDISELKQAGEKLSYQASHDDLTGLINRREFEYRTELLLSAAKKNGEHSALCFMDLDQFKVVNDTCGHIAGDEMLRQLTTALKAVVRKSDTLARLGGDEFGILIEHCSLENAHRVASLLQKTIQNYQFSWKDNTFKVGVSIGLVPITGMTANQVQLMKDADAACYMAKEKGRNRIHVSDDNDVEMSERYGEMKWVTQITQSLEKNTFCLYAQTIAALSANSGEHYELLIRMTDENGNVISPGAFLPAAERYSLMTKIDCWVLENAFSLLAAHPDFLKQIDFCSINLSGQSLTSPEILKIITSQLKKTAVDAEKICFEITETAAIFNFNIAMNFITTLKQLGCRFALDDFGSGLSSFAYLKRLPVDYLKIDGLFVKDIVDDPIDHAMVKSINEIGQLMGMQTIAEFVENDEIKGLLEQIGVNYAQGYGIDKPVAFDELLEQHRKNSSGDYTGSSR